MIKTMIGTVTLLFSTSALAFGHGGISKSSYSTTYTPPKSTYVTPKATYTPSTIGTGSNSSYKYVAPHVTKTGTYVQPHYRTIADDTKLNNYSTKGNLNTHTGKIGTVDPYKKK